VNRRRCYIAAPINSLSFDAARSRNRAIAAELEAAGFTALDPLDFPRASELAGLVGDLDARAAALGLATAEAIVSSCLVLIESADAVLFDLRGFKASGAQTWGTPCEMMYAVHKSKQCVVVVDDFHSAWINVLCPQSSTTLEGAISLLVENLSAVPV
jgi:nucleoside 2-deoxyribosyltransferase